MPKKEIRDILLAVCLIVFVVLSVSLFYHNNLLVLILVLIGCAVGLGLWHEKEDVGCFVIVVIVGPIAEIVAIHFGAWTYANPSFLGIPIWLIPLYGALILAVRRIAYSVPRLGKSGNVRKR